MSQKFWKGVYLAIEEQKDFGINSAEPKENQETCTYRGWRRSL